MRRIGVYVIAMVVLLLATASASAAAKHKVVPKCPPKHSRIRVADVQAVVYERLDAQGNVDVFGCAGSHGKSHLLGETPRPSSLGGGGVELETLAGTMVAYEQSAEQESLLGEPGEHEWWVVVRDLRNGRLVRRVPTGATRKPQDVGIGPVVGMVVKSDGAVAWIARIAEALVRGKPWEYEVHAVDKTGSRLLESGADIDPSSLALAGSTLYWTQGGRPMSAVLN